MTSNGHSDPSDPLPMQQALPPAGGIRRVALLHGAGYAGGEIIRLLTGHPTISLVAATSRTFAGKPVWTAHRHLRGQTDLEFVTEDHVDFSSLDAVLIAAEHGQGVAVVQKLLARGYSGAIVDLSADFRFKKAALYEPWFNFAHPAPDLLDRFVYGLPEAHAPYPQGTQWIANPGCFATGITLALWPLAKHLPAFYAPITALTGASGSGATPKMTTHYPLRDGNVRAYKVLAHQHTPEIQQTLGPHAKLAFIPVSGPWTRGIWGTAQVTLPEGVGEDHVSGWFAGAYARAPFVRLWPGTLPELRYAVGTPFCDLGWVVQERHLVVGFALDNLLKGAASQAIHNLNLVLGLPETSGLLPMPPMEMAWSE